MYNFESGGFTR